MMKTLQYILVISALLLSCDPLDVEPYTLIPADQAITDSKGLEAAVNGVYDGLQSGSISQEYVIFGDMLADNMVAVGSRIEYRQASDNRINPNNIAVEGIWNAHYDVINRVNNILPNLPNVTGISQQEIDQFRGQILFVRALCYFNLVRAFGPVPVKTEPTLGISASEIDLPREAIDTVYDQIVADLENAAEELSGTGAGNAALASEGAVLSLLAKVHLYRGDYDQAVLFATAVEALGYELVEGVNYASLFDEPSDNGEAIFVIDFTDDDVNGLADFTQPAARFEVAVTESAYDIFTVSDFRAEIAAPATSAVPYTNKYTSIGTDSDHPIILRYADVLLTKAEALNEQGYVADGEAFDLLNAVRTRAGLFSYSSTDLPNQQSFRLALEEERRKEFLGEGHRWFDLIRTGRALNVLSQEKDIDSPNQLLLPIPQSELDTNSNDNMTQNDGY